MKTRQKKSEDINILMNALTELLEDDLMSNKIRMNKYF